MSCSHPKLKMTVFTVAAALNLCWAVFAGVSSSAETACMAVLNRFTAPGVPAMGPTETEAPIGRWTNGIAPANLPGRGLAEHPMLCAGEGYNKMFLIRD